MEKGNFMKNIEKFIGQKMKYIGSLNNILDVGGGARFTKWLKKYKHYFNNSSYKTFDCDSTTQPDFVGDIHNMYLENESFDAIICSSVLEHVENPIQAVNEMYRILKMDGVLFCYIPSIYPYHARGGHYKDYWRFFDDTVYFLFKKFKNIEIVKFGGYFRALSFFFPLQHKFRFFLNPMSEFLDNAFKTNKKTTTAGYYIFVKK